MSEEGINFKILQALGTRTGQALDVQVIHPETSQVREETSRIVQKLLELLAKAELMKSALEVVAPDSSARLKRQTRCPTRVIGPGDGPGRSPRGDIDGLFA